MTNKKQLDIATRKEIAAELCNGKSYRQLASHYKTSKSTIERINKKLDIYLSFSESISAIESKRLPYRTQTDCIFDLIKEDFLKLRKKNVAVSKTIIKELAVKHAIKLGLKNFKFSNTWFLKCKKILNLKYKTLSGSAANYDKEAAEEFVANFYQHVEGYAPVDIFNCDESCFYLRGQNKKSFVVDETTEQKKDSEKITVHFTCSMVGEKYPPFYIGKSNNPRCFKEADLSSLDIKYAANKSAFMTSILFNEYLDSLNDKMKHEGRKIILLMDNCKSHKCKAYTNIKIVFLPKNTSALIQPLDMGIIHSVKQRYRRKIGSFMAESVDDESISLKKIRVLEIILWIDTIWKSLEEAIVKNCWKKAGLYILDDEEKEKINNEHEKNDLFESNSASTEDPCYLISEIEVVNFDEQSKILDIEDMKQIKQNLFSLKSILDGTNPYIFGQIVKLEELIDKDIIERGMKGNIRYWTKKFD